MLSVFVLGKNVRSSLTNNFLRFNIYKLCRLNFGSYSNFTCNAVDDRKGLLKKNGGAGLYNIPSRYYFRFNVVNHLRKAKKNFKRWLIRDKVALSLYRSLQSVDLNEFYSFFGLPDTFNSWFVIFELHIWILMSQLKLNDRAGVKLRNNIIKFLWIDVESRLEEFTSTQKNVKKQLKELYERFPISLCIYDEGLLTTDIVLASALWYKFFDKCCDDPRKLEVLIIYIRHQVQHLSVLELELEDHSNTKMWLPLAPHIKTVLSTK